MSTGADPKTMPVTRDYEAGYARAFGERKSAKGGRFVMRCSTCDGVTFEPGGTRYDCGRCGGRDCVASVDASIAPPLQEEARNAPIMVDRFMEGSVSTEGIDIGSRTKRKDYMRVMGVTDKSDYKPDWGERVRAEQERAVSKSTRETVARIAYTDPRWKP